MGGNIQWGFTHGVAKQNKQNELISITFKQF